MDNIDVDKLGAYNALKEVCQTLIVFAEKQPKKTWQPTIRRLGINTTSGFIVTVSKR